MSRACRMALRTLSTSSGLGVRPVSSEAIMSRIRSAGVPAQRRAWCAHGRTASDGMASMQMGNEPDASRCSDGEKKCAGFGQQMCHGQVICLM